MRDEKCAICESRSVGLSDDKRISKTECVVLGEPACERKIADQMKERKREGFLYSSPARLSVAAAGHQSTCVECFASLVCLLHFNWSQTKRSGYCPLESKPKSLRKTQIQSFDGSQGPRCVVGVMVNALSGHFSPRNDCVNQMMLQL